MPEAITKFAINSTLGTANFKPLDKIIEGQRSLGASDAVMAVPVLNEITMGSASPRTLLATFTPKVNGSVRILASMKRGPSSANSTAYIYVTENGTDITSFSTDESSYTEVYKDIKITAGKEYKVYFYGSYNGEKINSLKICASVIDTSLLGEVI